MNPVIDGTIIISENHREVVRPWIVFFFLASLEKVPLSADQPLCHLSNWTQGGWTSTQDPRSWKPAAVSTVGAVIKVDRDEHCTISIDLKRLFAGKTVTGCENDVRTETRKWPWRASPLWEFQQTDNGLSYDEIHIGACSENISKKIFCNRQQNCNVHQRCWRRSYNMFLQLKAEPLRQLFVQVRVSLSSASPWRKQAVLPQMPESGQNTIIRALGVIYMNRRALGEGTLTNRPLVSPKVWDLGPAASKMWAGLC